MRRTILSLVAAVLSVNTLFGAALSDKVPGDAVVYIGWQGTKALAPAYEKSRTRQIVDAGDGAMVRPYFRQVIRQISTGREKWAQALRALSPAIEAGLDNPTALYIGSGEEPKVVVIMDAGPSAPTLVGQMETAITALGDPDTLVRAVGNYLVVGKGIDDDLLNLIAGAGAGTGAGDNASPLAQQAGFARMLKEVDPQAALTCYLNVDALNASLAKDSPQGAPIRNALNLQGLHGVVYSAGFDGSSWSTRTFVSAPAPRSGIGAFLERKPLSPELLRVIPKDATLAMAGTFDLASALDLTRKVLSANPADARTLRSFQQGLGAAKAATNVDLETELAASLGSEWALYASPAIGGTRITGWVLANRLKNPDLAEQSLSRMENAICAIASQGMRGSKLQLSPFTTQQGGATVHYLGLAAISPAWAIQDGTLYLGGYPQTVASALAIAKAGGESILQNPTVKAAKDRLGQVPGGIGYVDLPATCADGYGMALLLGRYVLGFSDMLGVQSPPMLLPPLHRLQPVMEPSVSVSWSDDAGWHKRSTEPFPFSDIFAGDLSAGGLITPAMLAAVVIPQFTNASDDARQSALMSTTQSLRSQMELYNLQHNGYPDFAKYPNWEQLLQKTSEGGIPSPTGKYGPYLMNPPINPWNNQSGVEVTTTAVRPGYRPRDLKAGWIFDGTSHRFYPIGRDGVVLMIP